jgi:predicted RNase H-like HicB family nuclease
MQVVALIHDENGVYGASFPDFPGATTVADSADRVLAKAAEVLAFHAEGMAQDGLPLRRIRSLDELRRDPTFREDAEGAIIALVPFTLSTGAVRVNITIEESLLARADRAAAAEGETRSGFIATALRERLSGLRNPD